jgi:hypothetical protein
VQILIDAEGGLGKSAFIQDVLPTIDAMSVQFLYVLCFVYRQKLSYDALTKVVLDTVMVPVTKWRSVHHILVGEPYMNNWLVSMA